MEGTGSYGAQFCRLLQDDGFDVVEAITPTRRARGNKGKDDQIDAELAARTILPLDVHRLTRPKHGEQRGALRVLLTARGEMTREHTRAKNALLALLRIIDLGIDARHPLTGSQIATIAAWRHRTEPVDQATARSEARRLARRIRELDTELESNKAACDQLVRAQAPGLQDLTGIGPITAATIWCAYSHPGRIPTEAAFAALAGVAPIPASSGNTTRHRLSRRGDRQLNRALHVIAMTRATCDPETRAYIQRRTEQGKTRREILRTLKRYIARQIYRTLTNRTP